MSIISPLPSDVGSPVALTGDEGTIEGTKWNDLNGNGQWDQPAEPGLEGWTIYVDANENNQLDPGELSTTTAPDGSYSLGPLAPGDYTIAEVPQEGWEQTHPYPSGVERVSAASDGGDANEGSGFPSISADGSLVAFASSASNLVPGDNNGWPDIFVRNRQTGEVERLAIEAFEKPSISADGRFIAFISVVPFVSGDHNDDNDVFVYDRQTGQNEQVSVASDGTPGDLGSGNSGVAISADGRFVAFQSRARNLVPGVGGDGLPKVFVHDRQTHETEFASVAFNGVQQSEYSGEYIAISADGRFVTFDSYASNLVPGDTNGVRWTSSFTICRPVRWNT